MLRDGRPADRQLARELADGAAGAPRGARRSRAASGRRARSSRRLGKSPLTVSFHLRARVSSGKPLAASSQQPQPDVLGHADRRARGRRTRGDRRAGSACPRQPPTTSRNSAPLSNSSGTSIMCSLVDGEQAGIDRCAIRHVDGVDRPPASRACRAAQGRPRSSSTGELRRQRLAVDHEPSGDERRVESPQGVHDALDRNASERPAAEREIEAAVARRRAPRRRGPRSARARARRRDRAASPSRRCSADRVERVHRRRVLGREDGQPAAAAADLDDAACRRGRRARPIAAVSVPSGSRRCIDVTIRRSGALDAVAAGRGPVRVGARRDCRTRARGTEVIGVQLAGALEVAAAQTARARTARGSTIIHAGLVARIVEPMAPYFAALRRVSSNAERA